MNQAPTTARKPPTRPFHENVVDAILQASTDNLKLLGSILLSTKIPKNHDQIIRVWQERLKAMCWGDGEALGVAEKLLEEKKSAAQKTEVE